MGLIKNKNPNAHWLENYGYKYKPIPVAGYFPGYERVYHHEGGSECLWVNVCFSKRVVFLYNEYWCGGFLWERKLIIPSEICESDEEKFIDWLDEELNII